MLLVCSSKEADLKKKGMVFCKIVPLSAVQCLLDIRIRFLLASPLILTSSEVSGLIPPKLYNSPLMQLVGILHLYPRWCPPLGG